ncbi:MAG TPA: hypothetical protein VHB30_05955, partial [Solirubrobacteraceae bacterium]|nr:hypothetical protein [Solirubrobacteraceae bacterium]
MRADLERVVVHLAGIDRRPTSEGERESAQWIAGELRAIGLEPVVEAEPAKGGFWWQLFALNATAALG